MPFPLDGKTVPPVWVESGGKYKKLYQDAEVQISLLNGQIATLQAQEAALQQQLATAQAQIQQDAATIASLQGQVTALNQQIAALQAQLTAYKSFGTFFWGPVTLVGGGIYIPPAFDNPVINVSVLTSPLIWGPVTRTGGGYP
jgi:multidrug efflux pump subunit AcrA (membrane-fusion protein)